MTNVSFPVMLVVIVFPDYFVIHYPTTRGWRREEGKSVAESLPARYVSNGIKKERVVVIE